MAQIRQHANARLTVRRRRETVSAILDGGWSVAAASERFQVDPKTARKWRDRFLAEGADGLADRSSRPHRCPTRTPPELRRRAIELRTRRRRGAAWIAQQVGVPWTSDTQRATAYRGFLHYCNHHRTHSALNWNTPASTIRDNLPGTHT